MMKRTLHLFLLLTLLIPFQSSTAISATYTYDHITAHRGSSGSAPENTASAVRQAILHGAGYAEIDVQLSADGVVVLYHDRTLTKLGNKKAITELTYSDIQHADAGSWFDAAYSGERIPTLIEIIELARDQIKLNIELKLYSSDSLLPEAVAELLDQMDFIQHSIVTSFDESAIRRIKMINPAIKTGLIVNQRKSLTNQQLWTSDIDVLSVKSKLVNRSLVKKANQNGKELHAWTVNTKKEMRRMLRFNVKSIITDYPETLYSIVKLRS